MPEVYRIFGFVIMFYSREHEPIHVHAKGGDGEAKFEYDGTKFVLVESRNIKVSMLSKLQKSIDENTDLIVNNWTKYFGNEN